MEKLDFSKEKEIGEFIADLNKAKTTQKAIAALHILGDLSIGRSMIGTFRDFHEKVVLRVKAVIRLADIDNYKRNDEGELSHANQAVHGKALQVLAGFLEGSNFYDEKKVVNNFPTDLLVGLIMLFSKKQNIPAREPAKKQVTDFLQRIYYSVTAEHYQYMKGLLVKEDSRAGIFNGFHRSVIVPLLLVGESSVLLNNNDYSSIEQIEAFINDTRPEKEIFLDIEDALFYWSEKKDIIKYHAAQACMLLKIRKVKAGAKKH